MRLRSIRPDLRSPDRMIDSGVDPEQTENGECARNVLGTQAKAIAVCERMIAWEAHVELWKRLHYSTSSQLVEEDREGRKHTYFVESISAVRTEQSAVAFSAQVGSTGACQEQQHNTY